MFWCNYDEGKHKALTGLAIATNEFVLWQTKHNTEVVGKIGDLIDLLKIQNERIQQLERGFMVLSKVIEQNQEQQSHKKEF